MSGQERDWDTIPSLIYVRIEGGKGEKDDGILEEENGRGRKSY